MRIHWIVALFSSCVPMALFAARGPTTAPDPNEASLRNIVQLTAGFDRAGEAYFSPDMEWIVFQAAPRGAKQYQMFVAKLEKEGGRVVGAGEPTQISSDVSRNTCGYFSPDGNSLIFASTAGKEKPEEPASGYQRQGGNYRWEFPEGMEIYRADGWKEKVLKAGPGGKADLLAAKAARALTDNNAYDAECAFSPDGRHVCYTSQRDGDLDVFVMKADGSKPARITTAKGYDGGPFFSPDGKRLLYRSDRKNNNLLQVFVCGLKFGEDGAASPDGETQLTDDANVNWGPSWHPDGKHIVYATSAHGHANYELYLMRDDGSRKTRITYAPGPDILPVFSPDGKSLMWTSRRTADHTTEIFLADFKMPEEE